MATTKQVIPRYFYAAYSEKLFGTKDRINY